METWTPQDYKALKDAEGVLTSTQLSQQLGKTKYSVQTMASRQGVKLRKKVREQGGDIYFNGAPCLMFMSLEQMCRTNDVTFKIREK
jgi:hypothetical protein